MSRAAVARAYADAFLDLEGRDADDNAWLQMLTDVADLYRSSPPFKAFLHTPAVSEEDKTRVLRAVFGERYPELFVRFLLIVVQKRRQGLLPEIDTAARDLLYERTGRVHAAVTMAREPDQGFRDEIKQHLSRVLDREVDADFRTDPRLIGGLVVRVGDKVLDGSVRRRMQTLRRSLLETHTQSAG
jgi:F-type H+-transporting ATPase subunit delta